MMMELPVPPVKKRGWPILAWLVILGVVGFILWRNGDKPTRDPSSWLVPLQAQSRYFVAVSALKLPGATGQQLYDQARALLAREGYSQRLRLAILAGELVGPQEALDELKKMEEAFASDAEVSDRSREAGRLLRQLYKGYEADPSTPSLAEDDQTKLREGLGWFGDLALAPAGGDEDARAKAIAPAYRTLLAYAFVGSAGLIALFFGTILFVVVCLLALVGKLKGGLRCGSGYGGIYAETFALYMLLYLCMGFLFRLLPESWTGLWLSGVAMLLSLVALGWPILRGISWRQVREDIGLGVGKRPLFEIISGIGCYLCAVPALFCGILIMFLLMLLQRRLGFGDPMADGGPSHPIMGVALRAGWWVWVQVFVVACILAPLVEEIMFRGILYRHLREGSHRWGRIASVLFAAMLSSFVFAVIHPQGWLGVPPLMALALVFALAREWRQTLLPPMIAHGINNGVSTLMLLMMAS